MKNASGGVIKNPSSDEARNTGNSQTWTKGGSNPSKGSSMGGNHLSSPRDEACGMPSKMGSGGKSC